MKTYIVAVPYLVNAANKKAARKAAEEMMVRENQVSAESVRGLIPLRNVANAYGRKANILMRLT